MGRIWSALLRITTMLIFTLRPASSIRPMPDRTVARSPLRVMARKAAASRVFRLTLMRRSPAAMINLESLHVFLRMRYGRVNIPDVFRIGYGLGRRGGVRPVR